MKMIIFFACILLAFSAESQSLKDALYGGKLKADTGAVIRKGDSLKIKENIAQKIIEDSIKKEERALEKQNAFAAGLDTNSTGNSGISTEQSSSEKNDKSIPADNNLIWKSFIDTVSSSVRSEVITSNKLKKGAYSVLIEYEIRPDGQININSVASDPQNSFLEGQIKVRLMLDAPQMNPVMGTNGKPRTVAKKQLLSFMK
ncbi:MAG: hypothetical protein ACSLE0_16485 [Chitinophagaceae bacterium]